MPDGDKTPLDNPMPAITVAFYKRRDSFLAVLSTDPWLPGFMALESERVDMSNDEERRATVQIFMDCLARVMQQKVFPQDTPILEIEQIGEHRVIKSATFPDGTVALEGGVIALRKVDAAAVGVPPAAPATQ